MNVEKIQTSSWKTPGWDLTFLLQGNSMANCANMQPPTHVLVLWICKEIQKLKKKIKEILTKQEISEKWMSYPCLGCM